MAFKGFFKSIKDEVKNEVNKQLDKLANQNSKDDPDQSKKPDFSGVEGILNLISGGGTQAVGGSAGGEGKPGGNGLQQILGAIQGVGGILPGLKLDGIDKLLPTVMKVAEIIGKGMGDDTPRTETNPDGSSIDEFVKTLVDGRKIHAGGGSKRVMELTAVSTRVRTVLLLNINCSLGLSKF